MLAKKRKLMTTIKGPAAAGIIRALSNEDDILWQPTQSALGEAELGVWRETLKDEPYFKTFGGYV